MIIKNLFTEFLESLYSRRRKINIPGKKSRFTKPQIPESHQMIITKKSVTVILFWLFKNPKDNLFFTL
jgi:hypothetical protein